jgi:hypothetical protein
MIYRIHTKNAETLVNMNECILMQYAPVQPGKVRSSADLL